MKHPIGFCVQPRAPEAASPTPAAQPEAAAVPSVVRVYFPERDRAYSYYNDRFDLHEGDVVYVSGKLAGLLGRVAAVDYNFRIRLADYERVIARRTGTCAGTFYVFGTHMLTLDHGALPYAQVRAGFSGRRRTGSLSPATAPDRRTRWTFSIRCPCRARLPARDTPAMPRGGWSTCRSTAHRGTPSCQGTVPHELTFTYTAARSARSRAPVMRRG